MSEEQKKWLLIGAAIVIALIILWLLWRTRAGAPGTGVAAAPGPSAVAPSGQQQFIPTELSFPQIPAASINISFQNPQLAFTNQATGYVPLFGYIGFGGYGFGG